MTADVVVEHTEEAVLRLIARNSLMATIVKYTGFTRDEIRRIGTSNGWTWDPPSMHFLNPEQVRERDQAKREAKEAKAREREQAKREAKEEERLYRENLKTARLAALKRQLRIRLLGEETPGNWWSRALCSQTDPDAFYPPDEDDATLIGEGSFPLSATNEAKEVCWRCPVRAECLDWALEHHEQGVWGGTTEYERRGLRKAAA
jgi:WhiB family redox-sensing transcriptional regulator